MVIHILGHRSALNFVPGVETYALRIFDTYGRNSAHKKKNKLQQSGLFTIREYTFDDLDLIAELSFHPEHALSYLGSKRVLLDEKQAAKIIQDFQEHKDKCIDLLVHCTQGISRSPAIAISLNELFNLGEDSEKLKETYRSYNRYVYDVMMKIGRKK
ncbi:MAG: hypothetical protein ABIH82_01880 [Candidatus Woesearchaeota archaeon]